MSKLYKKVTKDFVVVSNRITRDPNLRLADKGLLTFLLSLPDGWNFSVNGLAAILPEGINMPIDYASLAIDAISSDPDGSSFALNVFLCVLIHLPYLLIAYILYKLIRFYLQSWCCSSFGFL